MAQPNPQPEGKTRVLIAHQDLVQAKKLAGQLPRNYAVTATDTLETIFSETAKHVDVLLINSDFFNTLPNDIVWGIACGTTDCKVILLGESTPVTDAIRNGFDDCLSRPITPGKIEETVEQVCTRQVYESVIDDLWRVLHTKALLRKELNDEEIEKSESYRVLQQHQSSLESLADELENDLEKKDFTALFRDASSGSRLVRRSVS